jgi:nitrogen fixation protein NifU and related proteins
MYTKTVMEHFANPRNVGTIANADGYARVESPIHNDVIELTIRVQDDTVSEVKYRTFGCAAVIASSSMTSVLATGLSLEAAAALTDEQVVTALGGLPEGKAQCSLLAPTALHQAVADYLARKQQAQAAERD